MASTTVPKKCYSTMPIFDDFWALLNFFYFPASRLHLALVVVATTVPKQRLFISANFWLLLALLKILLFFGGNVVLRHCWALVQQRRKECCSKMPTFDDFKHCLTFFCFSEAVLCFSTVEGYNSAKKSCSTMTRFDAFRHCWAFLYSGGNVIVRRFWWLVLQCGNKVC